MVIFAAILAIFASRIRMPGIVVYMVVGLILGPLTGLVTEDQILQLISDSGVVLLLFLVGLEMSAGRIADLGAVALVGGIGQVVLTLFLSGSLTYLLGYPAVESAYIATAVTFSSTVVVVKLLDQKGELDSLYGRIAVGISLVQSIIVVILLTVLSGMGTAAGGFGVLLGIGRSFLALGIFAVLLYACARYILPYPFTWAARSSDTIFIWSLAWCFLMVVLANRLGLSPEIGAFMAGISLAQDSYAGDLRRRVHPIMTFFIVIFFILLGARMDFAAAESQLLAALLLSVLVLLTNSLIFFVLITRMRYSEKTAFYAGVSMSQISEFSFIFIAAGISAGAISADILSLFSMIGIVTISISAYMIVYSDQLYAFAQSRGLLRWLRAREDPPDQRSLTGNHIIIVGMNTLGRELARELHDRGEMVLAIDNDPHKLMDLPCAIMHGNIEYASTLNEAGFARAKLLISALQIEDTNNLLAFRCKDAGIPYVVHSRDPSMKDGLERIGAAFIISPKESVVPTFKERLARGDLL